LLISFNVGAVTTMNNTSTGILDPDDPGRWLVCPWPARATFCEVVDYFMMAGLWRGFSDVSVASRLAYYEGYQAALRAAPTDDLVHSVAWEWRDELLTCIDGRVAHYRAEHAAAGD
jgi:hypothetical protein